MRNLTLVAAAATGEATGVLSKVVTQQMMSGVLDLSLIHI